MNTKRIVLSAIIAALPLVARAENISGAMYTAPASETNLTPAPTTDADAPYGRVNIDTDDQEHIATTAYVKGAYNSVIAAVNKLEDDIYFGDKGVRDDFDMQINSKRVSIYTTWGNDTAAATTKVALTDQ